MKRIVIVVLLAIAGCNPLEEHIYFHNEPTPDRISRHGVHIHAQGHDAYLHENSVEDQQEWLMGQLEHKGYPRERMEDCLKKVQLWIWDLDEIMSWNWGGVRAVGYQDGNRLHVGAYPCPWDSAVIHETAHWFQTCVMNVTDYDHVDSIWDVVNARPHGGAYGVDEVCR